MQKMITGFAALLIAVAAIAQTNQSQIVGFSTMETTGTKMDIFGVSFQKVGVFFGSVSGEDADLTIQDIQPGTGYGDGADLIRVWNPITGQYVEAYYCDETVDENEQNCGSGWGDAGGIRLDIPIAAGQGYWLTTIGNASAAVAGEVLPKTDNIVPTLAKKMDLICNTFPVAINIQDVKPVSGIKGRGVDLLRVWNPLTETYVYAYYCSSTYDSTWTTDLGEGWADSYWIRLNVPIAVGQGFWLTTDADSEVSFPVPLVIKEEN